jgi:predicted RecB family nuclease
VDRLDEPSEVAVIDAWVARVRELCDERGIPLAAARIYHWSPAETSSLTNAYNAARVRHPENDWPELPWFDLLTEVVKAAPVTVTGAFNFGLKAIAKAMHAQGLIETSWGDGPTDGMGAMVAAWRVDEAVAQSGGKLLDDPLMHEVADYNRVDCQVMAEILEWLRRREVRA